MMITISFGSGSAALTRAVLVIILVRCSRCLLLCLGLHGQRLHGSEEGIWSLCLLQFSLGTEERRVVVHGVCIAQYPVEGAEMSTKMDHERDCLMYTDGTRTGHYRAGR